MPIKIIIADDHFIFRDGLKLLIKKINSHKEELKLVAEAENGKQLIELVEKLQPDVILIDVQMPVMDGIEASNIIHKNFPAIGIIALSTFNEEGLVMDMLHAGARGYLLKNTNKEELYKAIKHVHEGKTYYCAETSIHLTRKIEEDKSLHHQERILKSLTEREIQVIELVCKGQTNKEIASNLKLSKRTVESYREKIMEKIDARNAMEIMTFAIKNKIHKV